MKNTQENGPATLGWQPSRPGQDHHEQQGSGSGNQPDIQPASGRDGDCGEMTGSMVTMFDRLRDAATKHDRDCRVLPLLQDGAATSKRPRAGGLSAEAGDDTSPSDPS